MVGATDSARQLRESSADSTRSPCLADLEYLRRLRNLQGALRRVVVDIAGAPPEALKPGMDGLASAEDEKTAIDFLRNVVSPPNLGLLAAENGRLRADLEAAGARISELERLRRQVEGCRSLEREAVEAALGCCDAGAPGALPAPTEPAVSALQRRMGSAKALYQKEALSSAPSTPLQRPLGWRECRRPPSPTSSGNPALQRLLAMVETMTPPSSRSRSHSRSPSPVPVVSPELPSLGLLRSIPPSRVSLFSERDALSNSSPTFRSHGVEPTVAHHLPCRHPRHIEVPSRPVFGAAASAPAVEPAVQPAPWERSQLVSRSPSPPRQPCLERFPAPLGEQRAAPQPGARHDGEGPAEAAEPLPPVEPLPRSELVKAHERPRSGVSLHSKFNCL